MQNVNKMAIMPVKKIFWKMGIPMIISMVLQALYNVVDSIFVTNIKDIGPLANEALTIAFPIQILIVAIGVGTGIGLNALLSKCLGMKNQEMVNDVARSGIFLGIVIYLIFLLFGIFLPEWFIGLFTSDILVLKMGTVYLRICTIFSLGSIGFSIYERFLQSTGKTLFSTIAQITGALTNIILDYVFIFPLNMGVSGAAWATIIGQFVSLIVAICFHYLTNYEIADKGLFYKPKLSIIKKIYQIGASAAIMQGLLSIMMAGINAIFETASVSSTILVGAFGIYYKIQQIALFSAFGLSNTMISLLSFNYGMKDYNRCKECIKFGIIDTIIVMLIFLILFETISYPLASLFAFENKSEILILTCSVACKIGSLGFIFMGFTIIIQGVLQAFGYSLKPLILSFLRLVIFVFPIAYLLSKSDNVLNVVWWSFPISEVLTSIIAYVFLKQAKNKKLSS